MCSVGLNNFLVQLNAYFDPLLKKNKQTNIHIRFDVWIETKIESGKEITISYRDIHNARPESIRSKLISSFDIFFCN
jgi:hypothetical protein